MVTLYHVASVCDAKAGDFVNFCLNFLFSFRAFIYSVLELVFLILMLIKIKYNFVILKLHNFIDVM